VLNEPQTRGITAEQSAHGTLKDVAFVELLNTLGSRQLHIVSGRKSADGVLPRHPAVVSSSEGCSSET